MLFNNMKVKYYLLEQSNIMNNRFQTSLVVCLKPIIVIQMLFPNVRAIQMIQYTDIMRMNKSVHMKKRDSVITEFST